LFGILFVLCANSRPIISLRRALNLIKSRPDCGARPCKKTVQPIVEKGDSSQKQNKSRLNSSIEIFHA